MDVVGRLGAGISAGMRLIVREAAADGGHLKLSELKAKLSNGGGERDWVGGPRLCEAQLSDGRGPIRTQDEPSVQNLLLGPNNRDRVLGSQGRTITAPAGRGWTRERCADNTLRRSDSGWSSAALRAARRLV